MNEKLIQLNIEKLTTKLDKVVNECLLKGEAVGDMHELNPKARPFDYVTIGHNEVIPNAGSIINNQIYAICDQLERLQNQLKIIDKVNSL